MLLENGKEVDTGAVETKDGRDLVGWDSRGRTTSSPSSTGAGTGLELEEFDIRNTTFPFNPGEAGGAFSGFR